MTSAVARIVVALTLSAVAALAILPLASRSCSEPAPARVQKCTGVLAPGESC